MDDPHTLREGDWRHFYVGFEGPVELSKKVFGSLRVALEGCSTCIAATEVSTPQSVLFFRLIWGLHVGVVTMESIMSTPTLHLALCFSPHGSHPRIAAQIDAGEAISMTQPATSTPGTPRLAHFEPVSTPNGSVAKSGV